jgi:hypothetical protein
MDQYTNIEVWLYTRDLYVSKSFEGTMPTHHNTIRSIVRYAKKLANVSKRRHVITKNSENIISLSFPGLDLNMRIDYNLEETGQYR